MNIAKNWVYSLADYRKIFALTEQDLQKEILDYPGGISSVNAELYALGQVIISADPAYQLSAKEMQDYAGQTLESAINYLRQHPQLLSAGNEAAMSTIIEGWRRSTEQFLADYEMGKKQGRYRALELPPQSGINETFELLLCTDFLFNPQLNSLYSAQELMSDLCQFAEEIRIFPLPEQKTAVNSELGPLMLAFQQRNYGVEVRALTDSPRRDANAILRVWAKECEVSK